MAIRRLLVGENVLVSREENGKDHEEGVVVDYYELLLEGETRPTVVVDFPDGERRWITAAEPNVIPIEPEEIEEPEADEADGEADDAGAETVGEPDAVAAAADEPADDSPVDPAPAS